MTESTPGPTPPPAGPPPGAGGEHESPAGPRRAPSTGSAEAHAPEASERTGNDDRTDPLPPPTTWPPAGGAPEGTDPTVSRPGLDGRERTLDLRIVNVWRFTAGITLLFLLAVLFTMAFVAFGRLGWIAVAAGLVLLWWRAWWLPKARYDRWRWQLTDLALELRYGVLVRQYEAVPYFRIQQIDITRGPIDRMLGLATLVVTTASASGSVALPGIAADDAPPVRAELLARAAEAVTEHPGDLQDAV